MPLCELLAQSHCFSRIGWQPCQCLPSLPHMLVSPILYTSLPACLSRHQAAIATSSLRHSQFPASVFLALIFQELSTFWIVFLSHVSLKQGISALSLKLIAIFFYKSKSFIRYMLQSDLLCTIMLTWL